MIFQNQCRSSISAFNSHPLRFFSPLFYISRYACANCSISDFAAIRKNQSKVPKNMSSNGTARTSILKHLELNRSFKSSQQKLIWNYLNCICHENNFQSQILIRCSLNGKHYSSFKHFLASLLPTSKSWKNFKTFWQNSFVWKYSVCFN